MRQYLGLTDQFPDGEATGCSVNNNTKHTFFILRQGRQITAFLDSCPHYPDVSLPFKKHQYLTGDKQYVMCSAHGALFNPTDGLCIQGPCKGQSLISVPLEITARGEIWIAKKIIEEFSL